MQIKQCGEVGEPLNRALFLLGGIEVERFTYPAEQFDERNLNKSIILTLVKKHDGPPAEK